MALTQWEDEYITSDLHLFHTNIIKYADRLYQRDSVTETIRMNWEIVRGIDRLIPDEPEVVLWNLGDVFYGKLLNKNTLSDLQELVKIMKGGNRTLKLVLGNHDKQFKQYAKWSKLEPLTKNSSLKEIFETIGFDYVYEYPIIRGKYILSHEPIFLKPDSGFINIHGHTHQKYVNEDYFQWKIENRDMVLKAYQDSDRVCPHPDDKKEDWESLTVCPRDYVNVCWDSSSPKVFSLNMILGSNEGSL